MVARREKAFRLVLSDQEHKMLRVLADENGVSMAGFIRQLIHRKNQDRASVRKRLHEQIRRAVDV